MRGPDERFLRPSAPFHEGHLEGGARRPERAPAESRGSRPGVAKVATGSYFLTMRTVGLKVLKNKLSEYVRLASQGERVLIADRDRVVAELVPPEPGRAERVSDAVLAGLVREGLVTPPLSPGHPLEVAHPRGARLADLLAELDADRSDR